VLCLQFALFYCILIKTHTEMELVMRLLLIITQVIILFISYTSSAKTNFEQNINVESCSTDKCKQEFQKLRGYVRLEVPLAHEMIGTFYYNGYGTEQNLEKARRYFYNGSRYGLPNSKFKLGIMMLEGQGGEVNTTLGLTNLRHAAKTLPKANYFIALYLLTNNPSQAEILEAKEKLELAAHKGHPRANYLLAKIYESAILGEADKEKAIELYKVAAIKDPRAKQKLINLGVDLLREPDNKDIERIAVVRKKQTIDLFISGLKNMPNVRHGTSSRIKGAACNVSMNCESVSGDEDIKRFIQGASKGL